RRKALHLFPFLRHVTQQHDSTVYEWFLLLPPVSEVISSGDTELLGRMFEFSDWCRRHGEIGARSCGICRRKSSSTAWNFGSTGCALTSVPRWMPCWVNDSHAAADRFDPPERGDAEARERYVLRSGCPRRVHIRQYGGPHAEREILGFGPDFGRRRKSE